MGKPASRILIVFLMLWSFGAVPRASAESNEQEPAIDKTLAELEGEILAEINRVRCNPAEYANRVLVPLKRTLTRVPEDSSKEFVAYKLIFEANSPVDYLEISEGDTEEQARELIDETIAALRETAPLSELKLNDVLVHAARFYSHDFLVGGKQRPAHQDSLGRKPGARIGSFGATQSVLDDWKRFCQSLNEQSKTVLYVFKEEDDFYRVHYPDENHCQYVSIPDSLGEFAVLHGSETTLEILDKPGFECTVRVDPPTRKLSHEDATVIYPLQMPIHGENVVWGNWSRKCAARGLVCWWLIDPGIPDRGHRHTLLDSDFKFCGVGCAWSRAIGWVATLDCSAEPLVAFPPEK